MKGTKATIVGICLVLLMLMVPFIASCGTTTSTTSTSTTSTTATTTTPQYGGTLTINDWRQVLTLGYPQKMAAGWVKRQAAPAIENLFRLDTKGNVVPWLATGYQLDANAKTITITLRQGVKFHDGTDFNAAAVKWNLDEAKKQGQFGTPLISSVDAVDNYTVRINLSQWDNTVLGNLATSYVGMMISPTAFQKNGADWAANNPVGTGPFKFDSWQKDVKITYTRFDGYWQKGEPYLDKIVDVYIPDLTVGLLSFEKGEADVMMDPYPKDKADIEKAGFPVTTMVGAFSAPTGVTFDNKNPDSPFTKLEVREAVQYAINPQALLDSIIFGLGQTTNQWTVPANPAYNPSIVGHPYDPAKAKTLMQQANYPNGFDTEIWYQQSATADQMFSAVQSQLNVVGIRTKLVPLTAAQSMAVWRDGGKWNGMMLLLPPPYPDVTAGLSDRYSGKGTNYAYVDWPQDYKDALANAISAPDLATKYKYTQDAEKLLIDKYCLVATWYYAAYIVAIRTGVHDTGIYTVLTDSQWTPESAWIQK